MDAVSWSTGDATFPPFGSMLGGEFSAFGVLEQLEDELHAMLQREEELAGCGSGGAGMMRAGRARSPCGARSHVDMHVLKWSETLDAMERALQVKTARDSSMVSPIKSRPTRAASPGRQQECKRMLRRVDARQQLHQLRSQLWLMARPSVPGAWPQAPHPAAQAAKGPPRAPDAPPSPLVEQLLGQQRQMMQLLRALAGDVELDAARMSAYKTKVRWLSVWLDQQAHGRGKLGVQPGDTPLL